VQPSWETGAISSVSLVGGSDRKDSAMGFRFYQHIREFVVIDGELKSYLGDAAARRKCATARCLLSPCLRSFLLICSVVICAGFSSAWAQGAAKSKRAQLDVVLVFDASGSMLKTDPQNLRYEGAKLLLSFLDDGDRLGIVQFASSAKVVQEMEVFSAAQVGRVTAKIQDIAAEGVFTDIAEGIKLGRAILETNPRAEAQRVIVLLSDGRVEPDPKVSPAFARTLELVHDILPGLRAKETRVFTLAFSDQADRAFLAEMAAATDGLTWFTKTPEDVHRSFAELFLAMKRPQVVAQTGRGFLIDSDVSEATFYINHLPGESLSLISPKGEEYSNNKRPDSVTWFSGTNFDVITVAEPDAGEWHVTGTQAHDGFATVLTDLKLLTDWPLVVRAGDELLVQARLYENEKPVSIPEMGPVLKLGFQISPTDKVAQPIVQEALNDEGQQGDKVAHDGIFSRTVSPLPVGAFKLEVVSKGPTFQRGQQIPFTVRPRLVTLGINKEEEVFEEEDEGHDTQANVSEADHGEDAAEESHDGDIVAGAQNDYAGDETAEFVVELSKEAAGFKKIEVAVVALSSEREKIELPVARATGSGRKFRASASDLPKDGTYKIKAVLKADAKKGEVVEAESPALVFTLTAKAPRPAAKPVVKQELEEKQAQGSVVEELPLIPIGVVSIFNLVALILAFVFVRSKKKKSSSGAQKYIPHKQLLDAVATLEERVAATSIETDDPIFEKLESEDVNRESEPETQPDKGQESTEQARAE